MASLKYFKVKGVNNRNDINLHKHNKKNTLYRNDFSIKYYARENAKENIRITKRENAQKMKRFLLFISGITILKFVVLFPIFLFEMLWASILSGLEYIFKINAYKELHYLEDDCCFGITNYQSSNKKGLKRKKGYAFKVFAITLVLYCALTTISFAIMGTINNKNLLLMSLGIGTGSLVLLIPILFGIYKLNNKKLLLPNGTSVINEVMRRPDSVIEKAYVYTGNYMLKVYSGNISYLLFGNNSSIIDYAAFKNKLQRKAENAPIRGIFKEKTFWLDDYRIIKRDSLQTAGWFFTDTAMYEVDKNPIFEL